MFSPADDIVSTHVSVTRSISGGHTGADRRDLDAASTLGIEHGSWCLVGRRARAVSRSAVTMDEPAARRLIETTLDLFFARDADLPADVGERCITHRIAVYMEELLRADGHTWSVDCEYNRMGDDPKRFAELAGRPNRAGGVRRGDAIPDIAVHRRGNAGPNVIAIEIKRVEDDLGDDEEKVRLYRDVLHYQHAFLLRIAAVRSECRLDPPRGVDQDSR